MHYYALHEEAYQKLRAQGHESWDQFLGQSGSFEAFGYKEFLEQALAQSVFASDAPKALEIGCGTGPGSCYLASRGFVVEGIDISATAIDIAIEQAQKRQISVTYRQSDVCTEPLAAENYDLIVDGHCTHCIVTEPDRRFVFANIYNALSQDGLFWISTMLGHDKCAFGEHSHWDEDGILWTRIKNPSDYDLVKTINKTSYIAQRRIYKDPAAIVSELKNTGFEMLWENIVKTEKADTPFSYQAICKKK